MFTDSAQRLRIASRSAALFSTFSPSAVLLTLLTAWRVHVPEVSFLPELLNTSNVFALPSEGRKIDCTFVSASACKTSGSSSTRFSIRHAPLPQNLRDPAHALFE